MTLNEDRRVTTDFKTIVAVLVSVITATLWLEHRFEQVNARMERVEQALRDKLHVSLDERGE